MAAIADRSLVLRFPPPLTLSQAQFSDFCVANPEVKMELTSQGEVVIVPTGWNTAKKNAYVLNRLTNWAYERNLGDAVGPDTGFDLPNGATRSSDAAFVSATRLAAVPRERLERFPTLCPDFVIDVRSASDRLRDQTAKMDEYIANGASLAWLLDPVESKAHVYRPGCQPVILDRPSTLSADPEVPGLTLDLSPFWD